MAAGRRLAQAAGKVTVRLRLPTVGRKLAGRLKGARLTLRTVQGSGGATEAVGLR